MNICLSGSLFATFNSKCCLENKQLYDDFTQTLLMVNTSKVLPENKQPTIAETNYTNSEMTEKPIMCQTQRRYDTLCSSRVGVILSNQIRHTVK